MTWTIPNILTTLRFLAAPGVVILFLYFTIGLTIPALAVAMIWLSGPLELGLEPTQIVLLVISVFVTGLTVVQGRVYALQGFVHLVLFAAFLFLSMQP